MTTHIFVSTITDGNMKSTNGDYREVQENRQRFLAKNGIEIQNTTLLQVVYEGNDYCRYATVADEDMGDGIASPPSIVSDALLTYTPGQALFLPIADCAPLVIWSDEKNAMMLSHLGRQSVEQGGGRKSIEYFLQETGVSPTSLRLWLGPAAGAENYPLWACENRGLHEVILDQLALAGVQPSQIEVSPVDVTKDPAYYSYSNFLKGLQVEAGDGRFAVVAVLR